MAARAGMGREAAHEIVKEHAVASAPAMRAHGTGNATGRLPASGPPSPDRPPGQM